MMHPDAFARGLLRAAHRSVEQRLVRPLRARVRTMILRAVIEMDADDSKDCQTVQGTLLADAVNPDIEHFEPYGFKSVPFAGAEGIFVAPMGVRSSGVMLSVTDRRYRPKGWLAGEVGIYDDKGQWVRLRRNKILELLTRELQVTASEKITATSPDSTFEGTAHATIKSPDLKLGSAAAAKGVVRVGDEIAPSATLAAFFVAITAALNGLAPGSLIPGTNVPAPGATIGSAPAGSATVKAAD